MSEKQPYSPEQTELQLPKTSPKGLENQIDGSAPPDAQAIKVPPTSDQEALKTELGAKSYPSDVEMHSRLASAEPAALKAPEAPAQIEQAKVVKPIEVNGFEKSGVMSNEDVQKYLQDTLPPEHISNNKITDISYPNTYRPEGTGVVLGECKTDGNTNVSQIELYNQTENGSVDQNELKYTLTHEVGHNVYYNLSPEQQQQWDQISLHSRSGEYVSDYAMTNVREDFAESYAHYVRSPEVLTDASPAKFNFMRDIVFKGRQYGA